MPLRTSRIRLAAAAAALALVPVGLVAAPAAASSGTCVGSGTGCFSSVQAAIDAAPAGTTVRIPKGSFAGGVTIAKSLSLVGAGAARTRLQGGGPVIRISTPGADRPHVTITGLTVTGGRTHGDDGVEAIGGGVLIDKGPDGGLGAVVVLRSVDVVGNRAEPTTTSASPSGVRCPDGDCPFAAARGGGIGSFGDLVLDHVSVTGNRASGTASDATGGGIFSQLGSLTVLHSAVTGNAAVPKRIGRYAEGGGVVFSGAALVVRDSAVDGNTADLRTRWPAFAGDEPIVLSANSGGLQVGDGGTVVMERTSISHNRVVGDDPLGEPIGFDGAMLVGDSPVTLRHVVIRGNSADTVAATSEDAGGPGGTALEVDGGGTVSDSIVSGNTAVATGTTGSADVTNAVGVFDFVGDPKPLLITRTAITGNTAKAVARHGAATVRAAGVWNNSLLTLRDAVVSGNRGVVTGASSIAQGGGIWNGPFLSGPPVELTLQRVLVTGNSVRGGTAEGGGLYTTEPVTLDRARIVGNRPDQCAGCSATTAPPAAQAKTLQVPTAHARPAGFR